MFGTYIDGLTEQYPPQILAGSCGFGTSGPGWDHVKEVVPLNLSWLFATREAGPHA